MAHAYTKFNAGIGRIWIPCHRRGAPRGGIQSNPDELKTHTYTHALPLGPNFLDKSLKSQKLGGLVAEIEAAGGTAAACYLDVTDEAAYETLFSAFSTGLNFISIVLLELFPIVLRRVC